MSMQLIGARLKALRDERGLSQDEVAAVFGFKDRQTVSAIETGERRVSADELLLAVERFGVHLDYFTDPFRLEGEGRFNWRQSGVGELRLDAYERLAGRWIAAYRHLVPRVGREKPLFRRALGLTKSSSFEEAAAAGERIAAAFALGDVPADRLGQAIERELGLLALNVRAFEGVSGAACRLPDLDTVLINWAEVEGRRNFDLAHELFHVLTWDAMPPERSESSAEVSRIRVEQLANNFASAVLMPKAALAKFGPWRGLDQHQLINRLNGTADALKITSLALMWRLVALGEITNATARSVPGVALRHNGQLMPRVEPAPLFSKPFVDVIGRAIDQGLVSVRRAAGLLDVNVEELSELFPPHGLVAPFEP